MQTALVTGAAGFIGSHLVNGLFDREWSVFGLENFSNDDRETANSERLSDAFTLIDSDVCDWETVRKVMGDADAVFHRSALESVQGYFEDPWIVTATNCTDTVTSGHEGIFNIAREASVTINPMVEVLNKALGRSVKPIHDDPHPEDIRHSETDISKAREMTGFEETMSFETGLERIVGGFQER